MGLLFFIAWWSFYFIVYANAMSRDPFVLNQQELVNQISAEKKISKIIKLNYLKASQLKALLQEAHGNLLSKEGSVIIEPNSNRVWLYDTPQNIQKILRFIHAMDVSSQQILIQARIVNVDSDYLHELGIKFGSQDTSIFSSTSPGLQIGQVQLPIAYLSPAKRLDMEISALEQQGKANIIANPHLMTEDRLPATIESGEEIPYQEKTSSGATNVAFKKAVLSLKVTPIITTHQKLELKLKVTQDKLSNRLVQDVPGIQTQELITQVVVRSGQTIVLGGVYQTVNENEVIEIPLLGNIPIVGRIFQHHKLRKKRRLLLVFITPEILPE